MSDDNEYVEKATKASSALVEIIKATSESEHGRVAAENLGKSAVTISHAINNILLPIAAINFAFDKSRKYFEEKFQSDIMKVTSGIENDSLIEPDLAVAGPALQGLAHSHEVDELRNMYLEILGMSMDAARTHQAHPAFVDVLRQISPFDAQLLKLVFEQSQTPIARVVFVDSEYDGTDEPKYVVPVRQHLLHIIDTDTCEISDDTRIELAIDNYIRLGLSTVLYGHVLVGEDQYSWAKNHPAFVSVYERSDNGLLPFDNGTRHLRVGIEFGVIDATIFGTHFVEAIGIASQKAYMQRGLTRP